MNKTELLIEMIERIRNEISVSEIANNFIRLKQYGVSYKAICPFHTDHKMGSFVITDKKGMFKCFSCGVGGDVIKFQSLITNKTYCESAIEIGYSKGIINTDEYELLNSYKISSNKKNKIEKIFIYKDKYKKQEKRAEITILNNVFRIFSKGNEFLGKKRLSKEHYDHLKEHRMLSDLEIENGLYFTFPTRHILKYFLSELESEGIELEELKSIPGFFYDKTNEKYSFTTIKGGGIGIPIINECGMVEGIQVRRDAIDEINGKKQSKYIWFSSSFADNYDNLEGGIGTGSPIDVNYPDSILGKGKTPCRTIFITEGRFKASSISKTYNSIALSVQGVTSWKNTSKCIENIRKIYKNQYIFDKIIIAYDADLYNIGILEQAIKMGLTLGGYSESEVFELTFIKNKSKKRVLPENINSNVYYALWDFEEGKGIDDFINNGHESKIKKVSLEKMYNLYISYKETILNLIEDKKYESIKDIPIWLIKELFEDIVLSQVIRV